MIYRKFKADYLFTGRDLADEGAVLVTTENGAVEAILPAGEAGEDVEHFRGMLSPGFINCHCHLELSHMRGVLPEKTGLVDFLLAVMRQRNAPLPPARGGGAAPDHIAGGDGSGESGAPHSAGGGDGLSPQEIIRSAMTDAEEEMLHNGIVAVGDICNTADSLPLKKAGRLYYHNFIETMGFSEQGARSRLDSSVAVFNSFAEAYHFPLAANSLAPHAPYSVSSRLFDLVANFPGNQLLTIHNQESEAENEFYRTGQGDFLRLYAAMGLDTSFFTGTGKRSLESYLQHFYRNQSLILVHNVATTEEDLQFAMRWQGRGAATSDPSAAEAMSQLPAANLFFCLCPNANLYISGQLPDVDLLLRHGCTIVTGTDSLASNHRLSILEELKTLQRRFPHLSTATLLQWATCNGAEALQLESVLGSFTPGRQPGVLLIENMEGERFTERSEVRRLV